MKKLLQFVSYMFFLFVCGMISCKKNVLENVSNEEGISVAGNMLPIAKAGTDVTIILPNDSVILNGSASKDPDGTISSYLWTKTEGPASFLIQHPSLLITTVNNLVEGTYLFELTVTDDKGAVSKDVVMVSVRPQIGPGACDISNFPEVNINLTPIGHLTLPQAPYVAVSGSKIFFGGGAHDYAAVDIYDVNQNSWSKIELSEARTNMAIVSCGNKIFFAGGNNDDLWYDIVDIYDVLTGSWTVRHLSEPRSVLAAATVGDKVFFAGGITEEGWNQTSVIDIYDISEDQWSTASLSEPKIGLTAVTAGNKIYFAGGWNYLSGINNQMIPLRSVDIYDASTNSWSNSSLSVISGGISGVAYGDKIYWGGINGSKSTGKIEIWDTKSGSVSSTCLSYARRYPAATVRNGDIIFFTTGSCGGSISSDELSDHFDIYNVETGVTSIGRLNQSIAGAAIICVNNTIYVAGGKSTSGYSNDVYILSW